MRRIPRSTPEPRRSGRGPRLLVATLSLAAACSRDVRAVRLQATLPGEEIYRITCEDRIQACRDEARRACEGPYEVLETAGASVEPPRVSSAPGPRSTGPRYARPQWVGTLVVACGPDAANPLATEATSPAPHVPAPHPERLCVPGVTQECLGPAACRGAQACLPDGDGYGPCDCGDANAAAPGSAFDAGAKAPR